MLVQELTLDSFCTNIYIMCLFKLTCASKFKISEIRLMLYGQNPPVRHGLLQMS